MRGSRIILSALMLALVLGGCASLPWAAPKPLSFDNPSAKGETYVSSYKLSYRCWGEGSPTVILESGLGNTLQVWQDVVPGIAATTRVCAYNRAGVGDSGKPRPGRTTKSWAQDLHTLLSHARIGGPYILVGHSAGGISSRWFQELYPKEVLGTVLVESSTPGDMQRQMTMRPDEAVAFYDNLKSWRLWVAETDPAKWPEGMDVLKEDAESPTLGSLGNLPLTVLTGTPGIPVVGENESPEQVEAYDQAWQEMQKKLATLSTQGQPARGPESRPHAAD